MNRSTYKICSSCVMDTSDPRIQFSSSGKCEYCQNFEGRFYQIGIMVRVSQTSLASLRIVLKSKERVKILIVLSV